VARAKPASDGSPRVRFVFQLSMARRDRSLLEELRTILGFGSITDHPRRKAEWQPMSAFTINSRKAHLASVVPFMDRFLLAPTHKRVQYEQWRSALFAYEDERPRRIGRSICLEEGCDGLVRGRGLCRRHYYRSTGY
jgi:hypothetical protein